LFNQVAPVIRCTAGGRHAGFHTKGIHAAGGGGFGKTWRAKIDLVKPRASIGRVQETSIPKGVNWDLYLGPSPYRAFTPNRFHYG
jgi:hypothetical protein